MIVIYSLAGVTSRTCEAIGFNGPVSEIAALISDSSIRHRKTYGLTSSVWMVPGTSEE